MHTEAIRNRYTDKIVIVTGGSRGIGEGCVRTFSEAGAKVVFCGLEAHRELGEQLVERYGLLGVGACSMSCVMCDIEI